MATFGTGGLKNLPRNIADGMVTDVVLGSTVAVLSGRKPQRFGNTDIITFNDKPKAEFVTEGADKASTTGSFDFVTATPKKTQVTMRFNQEVKWADEDYQLGVLKTLADAGATALARALDLGLYHRINPLPGTVISAWTNYLNSTTRRVEIGASGDAADPELNVENAVGLLVTNLKKVNGIAFDPSFAWRLATARYQSGGLAGQRKFPELGYSISPSVFQGLNASTSDTVSGRPEYTDAGSPATTINKVKAIVGDFQDGIYWGVQKELPLELIEFGDPDGGGDLKRKNQIALRLEIVYGWYVFPDKFAVIEDAA